MCWGQTMPSPEDNEVLSFCECELIENSVFADDQVKMG